jgi:hypothetical protein
MFACVSRIADGQLLGKHVLTAMNMQATIEELSYALFYMRSLSITQYIVKGK